MGAVVKPIKKVQRFVDKKFVEPVLEKPYKKVLKETKKIISPAAPKAPASTTAAPSTGAARGTEETVEAVLDTGSQVQRRRRRGKRALIAQPAAAQVGGEGGSGLNIPK